MGQAQAGGRRGLVYIHNRPIDVAEANVGAVMRMASAFVRAGLPFELTACAGRTGADPFARHGVEPGFPLHLTREREGPASYPALVFAALTRSRGGTVYTRVPQIALYAMAMGRQVVLEMHTPIAALRQGARLRRALNLFAPRLRGLVAISPALDAELAAELPRYTGPRLVAPSAAEDLAPAPGATPDHDLGYVGSLTPGKGGDVALALAEALPHLRVLIAGDAGGQPAIAQRLAALANVTALGPVAPADIGGVMGRFRVALAPYARVVRGAGGSGIDLGPWMSPLKIAEYASAGKAIVASRLPAVQAMAADGEQVRLCEPDDLPGWIQAVGDLLVDPDEILRLGRAARRLYEHGLSWDVRARRIIQAFSL